MTKGNFLLSYYQLLLYYTLQFPPAHENHIHLCIYIKGFNLFSKLHISKFLPFLNNTMYSEKVEQISECFIKPSHFSEEAKQPFHLGPWDLAMLSVQYIQKGLLFKKPQFSNDQENYIQILVDRLKDSVSVTLSHFYPLAGRFATKKQEDPHSYVVFIDCINSPGARFVHAAVDLTISDVLDPTYVPLIVQSFFDHDRAVNHDGHTVSLLTIQVTELKDGIFIGCSMNHAVGDGSSYWHFFNTLSEVYEAKIGNKVSKILRPPIHKRWFPDGYGPVFSLPYTHPDQFISSYESPELKERIFHFSDTALSRIKAKANGKFKESGIKISSLQALSALIWRCVTRVRGLPHDQITTCRMAVNNRSRLEPPLSENYFGNCIQTLGASTTAGNLLANDFEWAALQLNKAVAEHNNKNVRGFVQKWVQNPYIYQIGQHFDPTSVMIGSSPRFDMYGNEFGLGKAVAVLSGYAHKFDGKVTLYQGYEGGGYMDIELTLLPNLMTAFENDEEFLDALNFSPKIKCNDSE